MPSTTKKSSRVALLDEIRGYSIILMVVYHALYDMKYLFGMNVPTYFEDWFGIIRDIHAGVFIFISGAVCRYSRDNIKRGVQCFFFGMIMTFVSAFFYEPILFGILHFLGISMILFGLSQKLWDIIPPLAGIIGCAVLFTLTLSIRHGFIGIEGLFEWYLPQEAYNVGVLFPFGLTGRGFYSSDYFPLLPWFFVFLAGSFFGVWAKEGSLPRFFYPVHVRWLAFIGRHTLWIYLLHQPVLYGLFNLILG